MAHRHCPPPQWQVTAQISRDVLQESIPKQWLMPESKLPDRQSRKNVANFADECGLLDDLEIQMTKQNVSSLLEHYRTGEWTAEAVVTSFLKRSTVCHQLLNFATEFLAESAFETARSLDEHFKRTGSLIGPLHGIPVSVKEHVAIGGRICNASFVSKISNVASDDAHIVKLLKRAGAVIHNPLHPLLSPGGSSGGEGAALGFRCSVLGVGTDIGGSVRIPASFCNAYGFKPTALRNPSLGLVGVMGGQESIRGCVGPLSQNLDDLIAFERALMDQAPWDTETSLVPLQWRNVDVSKSRFTIGIMFDDGVVRPHPPVLRALKDAEHKLVLAGFEVKRWEPYNHAAGWDLVKKLYSADGGDRVRNALRESGEPTLPLTAYILGEGSKGAIGISENWNLNFEREAFRRDYHARMKAEGIDVILCPAYVGAGVLQGQAQYWNYTAVWNILDQPAVIFPSAISAEKLLDVVDDSYNPRSAVDRKEFETYDPELFDGVPVSLQLVGKHHQDETLLETARLVESALKEIDITAAKL